MKIKNAINARINKKVEIRKDKLNFKLHYNRPKENNIKQDIFNLNDSHEFHNNNNIIDIVHEGNEINDDRDSFDILLEDSSHEVLIDVVITDIDKYIDTYKIKTYNYSLSLESVCPNVNTLEYSKKYLLKDMDNDIQIIIQKFNSLNLYDVKSNILNKKRYDIINLFLRYKHIILDLIDKGISFVKITVNDQPKLSNDTFFNKYCVEINKYANTRVRLSQYFEKFENFTQDDLKEYKNFNEYVKLDIDKLMYIIGAREFYIYKNRKRTSRNHYCIVCNGITNEYYVNKHIKDKHPVDSDNISISINSAINQLGEVCVNSASEDKIMMNVFKRIYVICSQCDEIVFRTKLMDDVNKDEKIRNEFKKLLIKFVLLSGYNYDGNLYKMIKKIYGLSNDVLIKYYIYIVKRINF